MPRPSRGVLVPCVVAAVLLSASIADAQDPILTPTGFRNDLVFEGLDEPTSMAFLHDGRLLITEQRTGKVRMLVNGHLANNDPVLTVPQLVATGYEQGLQGIAVDPGWPARPYIYVYYNHQGAACYLVRYTGTGDVDDPSGENLGFGDPLTLIDDIPDNNPIHNSGCLRFGPDGHLFVSVGEDADQCLAQDSTSLKGELLHLDVSRLPASGGGPVPRALLIAPDHPYDTPDSNAMLVWAHGFRNPWRYHVDPITGIVYLADVGDVTWEELDEVKPGGGNYGWPYREGFALHVPPVGCPEPGGPGANPYIDPIASYDHDVGLVIGSGG